MKKRIITAAVLIPVLLLILLAAPKIVASLLWGVLLAIAAYELLFRTELVQDAQLIIYSSVMAFMISIWSYFGANHAYGQLGLMIFTMLLFGRMMLSHVKIHFETISMCMMAGVLIPFLLSSMIRILAMKIGKYMVLIPFVVAFTSDAGAYFAGHFFGQHKMAPVISAHKTVEGAVGGVLSAIVGMLIYATVLDLVFDFRVNYLFAVIYGFLGSLVGVMGDLCFSVVKRQTGIKDYGNLIPGHGGVLDRFDSMMLVAPLMEIFILILPLAV